MLNPEIQEVLDSLPIEAYLDREGIEYRETHGSSGAQLNIRTCPVCGTSKWKVFLNKETGLGNCFSGSCEAKFNRFSFIRHSSGLSGAGLDEHIKQVGREIGWRPKRKSVAVSHTTKALVIPESFELPIKGRNLAYLTNRGISLDATKYFHLRYCHDAFWDAGDYVVDFKRRVIIPVYDIDGNLISFQGRDITGTAEKKYLFPAGFASTGEHVYNSHNVRNTQRILIGEGVFDVIAMKIAVDEEPDLRDIVPVGTFGKHISLGQIDKFRIMKNRGVVEATMMWDGEFRALNDAIAAGLELHKLGLKVRVAQLPSGKDPNEITALELRQCFYRAKPLTRKLAVAQMMALRSDKTYRK